MSILEKVNSPKDIKGLSVEALKELANDIRIGILNRNSEIGGHVGPNLGIVETAIALHYVFESPKDKIVWDVSHQCYPHKMLTGRKEGFLSKAGMSKISGYTNQDESEHDLFKVGHTSTSVSLACGLAKARDLKKENHNVIAIIGDGSLSGGEALEGFNNASILNSNIIIIINDNEMSIAENSGGLYYNLRQLRESNGQLENNLFKALGFEYHYVSNGNSIEDMIDTLSKVKNTNKPTIVHIHTLKGKGYKFAEQNKEPWHWHIPFDIESGESKFDLSGDNYNDLTYNYLKDKLQNDKSIVVVNAGTPGIFGFNAERRAEFGENYVDVGIAEEHAVAFSSALAKGGCKPVFMVMSSFVQRTYDQLSQDLALNNNPAVILVAWGGISGADMTHLCSFDISMMSNIPNLVYLAPTNVEEYLAMLNWSMNQNNYPVVIRMPKEFVHTDRKVSDDYSCLNTYEVVKQGSDVAVIAEGSFFNLGKQVCDEFNKHGITPTLINPRYLTGIDENCLSELEKSHKIVVTLEDGELDGGFGEKITRFYGAKDMKVLNFGALKEFTDRVPLSDLYERYHLTPVQIVNDVLKMIK